MRMPSSIRMIFLCWPLLQGCAGVPATASYCAPGDQACVRGKMQGVLSTQAPVWQSAPAAPGELLPPATQAAEAAGTPPSKPPASREARRAVPASPVTVAPVSPPVSLPRAVAPVPAAPPAPPPAVTTCDAGGCWQAGGGRYEGGAGNAYLNGGGRLCQRQGHLMQCF